MLVLAEQFGVVFVFGYVCSYMLVAMGIFNATCLQPRVGLLIWECSAQLCKLCEHVDHIGTVIITYTILGFLMNSVV